MTDEFDLSIRLMAEAASLRVALTVQGWNVSASTSPIVPMVVGDEHAALDLAAKLRAAGHYAPAIRPPTVPAGECRLRLTVTLAHKDSDQRKLCAALARLRTM